MAVRGWLLDKSAAARSGHKGVAEQLAALAGSLFLCPVGQLEQLYSARSAQDYEILESELRSSFEIVPVPPDVFERRSIFSGTWLTITGCGIEHRSPIF